jgi:hypothetical protein
MYGGPQHGLDRLEHLVPPMPGPGEANRLQRPIGPGQFMPEQTVAEKLASAGAVNFELGEYDGLTALNRREVEMLLERYKQKDDMLAAEERHSAGHFSQQEIQARRKRPGVQAVGLDMIDNEDGVHVWSDAMKLSHGEASRSKISKVLNFRDLDQMRADLEMFIPRSFRDPEVDPSWTEAEVEAHKHRLARDMKLTKFEIALLVNLNPTTPQEARALIKPLHRFDNDDLQQIIKTVTERLRSTEDKSIEELYGFEHFGTQITENHIGPILGGGSSGLEGLSMGFRSGETDNSKLGVAGLGSSRLNANGKKPFDADFGDKV